MQELKSSTTMVLLALLAIGFCEAITTPVLASKPHGGTAPFHVAVRDANGTSVAGDSGHAAGAHSIDREYKPGYRIEVTGSQRMYESNSAVRLPTLLLTPLRTKCTECAESLLGQRLTRFDASFRCPQRNHGFR